MKASRSRLLPPIILALALAAALATTSSSRVRADAHYTLGGDGTVKDNWTGLTWQQTPDDGGGMAWTAAGPHCTALGLAGGGWRLPSVKELNSLYDDQSQRVPPMDPTAFPDTWWSGGYFWSSAVDVKNAGFALSVPIGGVYRDEQTSINNVRCVR